MQESRYIEICEHLEPSLAAMLNLIRRYVQANQASVMVGAGFSKNADMNSGVKMKEWNELGVEFYKHLYAADNPSKDEFYFKSPIRLASQYASFTTHAELDKLISDSLPDKSVNPGALHKKLMRLPWRDVFTTNYDTLLERTNPDWKQNYTVVTNRDTLIYSTSPRIVKLHGSFPDQHPFVMTEEDFRTYPNEHPEFVNTVRQSLIENLFCLIGFSGDDDNFLSWIGWLRDVIGKESVMCYMITYNANLHDSEVSLLQSRGITLINLKRLPLKDKEGYAEALDFFLTYITPKEKPEEEEWSGSLDEWPYEDLVQEIETMRKIRESYPGWPFLPAERLRDFRDIEQRAPFLEKKFEALTDEQKFKFAKELLWRIKISYSPLTFDWLVRYLDTVVANEDIRRPEITDIALDLLYSYRVSGDFDLFEKLYDRLEPIDAFGTSMQIHTCAYEMALSHIAMLNLSALKALLFAWDVPKEDTIPVLWKANMLTFIGDTDGAKVLLQAALQHIDSQSRSDNTLNLKMLKDVLQTSLYAIDFKGGTHPRPEKSLYVSYVEKLKMSLVNYEKSGRPGQQYIHTFNIGKRFRKWHSGTMGLYGDYIYSYRYLTMRDRLGFPLGTDEYGIDIENLKTFLSGFIKYEPIYALSYVIRSKKDEVVKSVVTRQVLHDIWAKERCEELYKSGYNQIFKNPKTKTEERLKSHILIPLFSRMCTRFCQDTIQDVFGVLLAHCSKQRRYDALREEMSIIYDCAEENTIANMLQLCLRAPLPDRSFQEVILPRCLLSKIDIADDVVNFLIDELVNTEVDKQTVIQRILKMWKWLTDSQKTAVREAIVAWRRDRNDVLALSSYQQICATEEEKGALSDICISVVNTLSHCTWQKGNSADEKDNVIEVMEKIVQLSDNFSFSLLQDIYGYLIGLLPEVYNTIPASNSKSLNEDYYYSYFESLFKKIIRQTAEQVRETSIAYSMQKEIDRIDIQTKTMLEPKLRLLSPKEISSNEKRYRVLISKRVSSKNRDTIEDGIQALKYSLYYSKNIISAYGSTFTYMKRTREERLVDYLQHSAEILMCADAGSVANYLGTMLEAMHEILSDNELSFEFKTDVSYFVGRIAGILDKMNLNPKNEVSKWKDYLDKPDVDTDVHNSFRQGQLMYLARINR